ncbi:hypothetical protein PIB30_090259, partial [Stylosanthes scabra]|nr:hypothetical protein [Stylosanthes scabra]
KNGERKLEEQEMKIWKHSGQSLDASQVRVHAKQPMPRHGSQRLGVAQHPPSSRNTQSQRLGVELNA